MLLQASLVLDERMLVAEMRAQDGAGEASGSMVSGR